MNKINSILNLVLERRKLYPIYFLLLLLLLSAAMFLFYSPLHVGADTMFHYNRLDILMQALREGSYPTYMDYNSLNGYGYLVNAFYPDLLLIPFAWIGNLTSLHTGYISLVFTCTILCGLFTYIAVKKVYKSEFIAVLVAILFTFASYRIFDIFYRGAIGEYIAFTFIPLVFWGGYEVIKGNSKKWYILAIGFSLLIYTHLISSVIVFITFAIYLLIYCKSLLKERKRIYALLIAALVSLILTAGYIVPMIEHMLSNDFYYTTKPSTDIIYSLSKMNDIIAGMFNVVESEYKLAPDPKIGGLLVALLFLRIAVRSKSKQLRSVDYGVILGIIFIFTASYSFPWGIFPFTMLSFIQHPCRLLLIVSFLFALAGSYYISQLVKTRNRRILAVLALTIVTLLILKADGSSNQKIFGNHPLLENKVLYGLTIGGAEYIPASTPSVSFLDNRESKVIAEKENTILSNFQKDKGHITFDAEVVATDNVELPLTYYKGYTATLNNEPISYQQSENGLIEIPINKSGLIEVKYTGTTLQSVCWYITIISILLLVAYIIYLKKKEKNASKIY